MTDITAVFLELGLSQYIDVFLDQGFDSWDTILDITESDLDILDVKLGHRRKLQRRIANHKSIHSRCDASPRKRATSVEEPSENCNEGSTKSDTAREGIAGGKRKYRRHPKADVHSPARPPSAYVLFSNKMRDDLKGRNLTFIEIAKLVGENWQALNTSAKKEYEDQAADAKTRYNMALDEYKKTDNYAHYQEYLAEFRTKQNTNVAESECKRTKLEEPPSSTSGGSSISSTHDKPSIRGGLPGFYNAPYESPSNPLPSLPALGLTHDSSRRSPPTPTVKPAGLGLLPGYRDLFISSRPKTAQWTDPSRSCTRPKNAPVPLDARHAGYDNETQFHIGAFKPPSLPMESTIGTTSTRSSIFSGPQTPREGESIFDRNEQTPQHFQAKTATLHDSARPLPLVARNPRDVMHSEPMSIDFPVMRQSFLPPLRSSHSNGHFLDEPLDPVSALLRAGEVLSSRGM